MARGDYFIYKYKKNFAYKIIEIFQNFLLNNSELIAQSDKMSFYFENRYKKK